jgi:hypothetical protein
MSTEPRPTIQTIYCASGVNMFRVYGQDFWTVAGAQKHIREVEELRDDPTS